VLIQALSGLASLTGPADADPTPVGASIIDQHAAVLAALGVLAALYERRNTRRGRKVESNLLNAALDLQIEPLHYHLNGFRSDRSETGIASPFYKAPYGVFKTADGYICLSITPSAKLARLFEDDSFLEVARDEEYARRDELNARVAAHVAQETTDHWIEACDRHAVWYAPVNDHDAVERDPQVTWNKAITTIDHPRAGPVRVLTHPIRYDGEAPAIRRLPPAIGEHTAEILAELGYDSRSVAALKETGTVGGDA
jgi:crotonobetainyl-CoA:carnitine CoA-transferase CaiB-like acyl-CoA transferase